MDKHFELIIEDQWMSFNLIMVFTVELHFAMVQAPVWIALEV